MDFSCAQSMWTYNEAAIELAAVVFGKPSGAPNGNFRENICSEDHLRTRIFGTFVVKFSCLPASPRIFEHLQNGIITHFKRIFTLKNRGTQREYSSKPLKHSIVKRILVFKR